MAGDTKVNTYISVADYLRAPTGHDTATLVGNATTLASPISAGATALPLSQATSKAQIVGDRVTIFDGSNSEVVTVTAIANIGVTSLTVTTTTYAHASGTSLCTDGAQGSLADMITTASAEIERYCRQPLLQATYSSERLPLRSMRAAVNRDFQLVLRPKRFPVQSVSSVTAQLNGSTTLNLAVSEAFIDADQQIVTLAQMTSTGGSVTFWGNISPPLRPTTPGWISLSYTAGYVYSALPYEIHQACIWLTSDLLSDRRNPTGAAEQQLGKEHIVSRLRGDTSGRSVLAIRAYENLEPYRQKPM
jgi:hypothetical protein